MKSTLVKHLLSELFDLLAIKDRKIVNTKEQTDIWCYQVFNQENWAVIEANFTLDV